MRTTRDGSHHTSVIDCVSNESKVLKSILVITLIGLVIGGASSMPQRNHVVFPSNANRNPMKNPNDNQTSQVPVLRPNGQENSNSLNNEFVGGSQGLNQQQQQNPQNAVFHQGTTGIACNRPGDFVMAPDGCNSCFCAENRQLSSVCSRAFCPPGFPSGSQGQFRL